MGQKVLDVENWLGAWESGWMVTPALLLIPGRDMCSSDLEGLRCCRFDAHGSWDVHLPMKSTLMGPLF